MIAAIVLSGVARAAGPPDDLLTVAESSGYTRTARHAEVIDLIDGIEERSTVLRRAELGRSVEGRVLPLVILADPPVASATEARATGKPIVFAFGNIHAGEVCGKEALLMLAREIALDPEHALLDDLVIVLAPIYNADGNDRFGPVAENRGNQVGPDEVGIRPNAQGFDLNRDYVKLESPEARALVRFLTEWDPHVTIDTHTTNGSRHAYTLTYAAPLNPSGHRPSIDYVRDAMLPRITERLRDRTGYDTFFYGNFDEGHTRWSTYSASPNFGGPYRGLRGQMSILSEAYSHASYEDRVLATLEFVREILHDVATHRDDILMLRERARTETKHAGAHPRPDDVVGLRFRPAAFADPVTIRGPEEDHTVVHVGRFEPTVSVRRPFGYVIPPGHDAVVEKLAQHGIERQPVQGLVAAEVYTVTGWRRAEREFQGHRQLSLDVDARRQRRTLPSGSVFVPTAQPLGTLAVYLLEPQSADGLAAWNFLDDAIEVGKDFPIVRVQFAGDLRP